MIKKQMSLTLSPYLDIYDLIIPKDNLLRQMNELVDFTFIYDELLNVYCQNNGRGAIDPVRMFKYLLLKSIFDISDVDVVERSRYDMSFKYFLGMTPEEEVIDASSLTKFRKLRLKDTNLLDLLINKTVEIALNQGIIKSKSIIVDSTHTQARYNQKSPREHLIECSKRLRKAVYTIDETIKEQLPLKVNNGLLEDELGYCQKLITVIENAEHISSYPAVRERLNMLKELVNDDLEQLALISQDTDAKVGHKTADTSFFGYKTHLAMTEERIITAAVVTSGEKHDGKQLQSLVEKSEQAGIEVNDIIGDAAYSEKENIAYAKENNMNLISKLSKTVTHQQSNRTNPNMFEFNKDAQMYVCQAGHMSFKKSSTRPRKHAKDGKGTVESYFFDVEKCKNCLVKAGCYKDGSKTKTYSVTIKHHMHEEQAAFQESEYFKVRSKERYKIEAKNSELKHRHGYDVASASGLLGMQLQAATSIFAVNLKRIISLASKK
ncbi:Transposase IS4 protein [Desulfitobacterium hafniense]|uniref:Transposase IS4 protein n=1 Tax=Desulfitobacterium hafniense TaxID=49338 RepID=A0A098AW44_DESHA|nr:IS1182 family transposase [Desulfitobacterium hafniense]CDX00839.1 Transposase IS4 protein [Desulfitobacterium hafniense]